MNYPNSSRDIDEQQKSFREKSATLGRQAYQQGSRPKENVHSVSISTKDAASSGAVNASAKAQAAGARTAAKEGAKKVAAGGIKKAASSVLTAALGPEVLMVLGIILLLILGPILLISAFPVGDLFQTQSQIETTEDKLYSAVHSSYIRERNSAKSQVMDFVNENYACDAGKGDITGEDGTFTIDTDTCSITVSFSPELSEMKENISAYINAVNGTIAYFGQETDDEITAYENGTHGTIDTYDGQIFQKNSDGSYTMTEGAQEFYNAHSNKLTNAGNEDYIKDLGIESEDFFVYDEKESRWSLNDFHIGPKTHQEYQIVGYEKIKNGRKETYVPVWDWVDVTVDAWYGDIGILMFYDLSGYKAEELAQCVSILEGKHTTIEAFADASGVVGSVLKEYYSDYVGQFRGYYTPDGSFVLGQDNRDEIFKALLEDGTLLYVPISGLTEVFLEGEPGYSGSLGFSGWDGMSSADIWREINRLRAEGTIGYRTSAWNCTAFAQAWLYKVYGPEAANAVYGDGRSMVNTLLSSDWGSQHFYRGSSPAPGGIFSISSPGGGNHVGCVDAVDYVNKTITFSDGNTNGAASYNATISIKRTLTFDEFENYVNSCCAYHGSAAGATVTYANPIP